MTSTGDTLWTGGEVSEWMNKWMWRTLVIETELKSLVNIWTNFNSIQIEELFVPFCWTIAFIAVRQPLSILVLLAKTGSQRNDWIDWAAYWIYNTAAPPSIDRGTVPGEEAAAEFTVPADWTERTTTHLHNGHCSPANFSLVQPNPVPGERAFAVHSEYRSRGPEKRFN